MAARAPTKSVALFARDRKLTTHSKLPKPAALRDAGSFALRGCAGMRLLLARVRLCEDL